MKITIYTGLIAAILLPFIAFGAGSLTLNQTVVNLTVGQNTTVIASPPSGQAVNLTAVTNSSVAYAVVNSNVITVYGLSTGSTQLTFCTYDNYCGNVWVNVGGGVSQSGQLTLSQSTVSIETGSVGTVAVYTNNGSSPYLSSSSNPNIASATITGNTLSVYAISEGVTTITLCAANATCANLNVFVNRGNNLTVNTTLPQPLFNQYYAVQLNTSGGNAPYSYTLYSGNLPFGLNLSNSGLISGVPSANSSGSFTVRVTDAFNRSVISNVINLSTGSVLGTTLYNNGTLINDGGTIFTTYKNTKSGFASMFAFTGLGYRLNNIIAASTASLANTGYVITTTAVPHPWGSWIKLGSTVYFVHETGLIPVPSYDIFIYNGGNGATVVESNVYDFMKPILPLMTYSDSRLR